jgi:hypothetical protein
MSTIAFRSSNGPFYQPRIREKNGAFGGMIIIRETEILGEKLPPIPLC